jgi:hypothetical protein
MLVDPGFDERALHDHLEAFGPHLIQRALDQPGADALAAEFGTSVWTKVMTPSASS